MKEELEFKDIYQYLPFDLQAIDGKQKLCRIVSAKDARIEVRYYDKINASFWRQYWEIKPILRPLSDLVKEININDNTFIPLERLFRLYDSGHFHSDSKGKTISNCKITAIKHNTYAHLWEDDYSLHHEDYNSDIKPHLRSFTYDPKLRRFAIRNETLNKPLSVGYQYELFQLLFEWHFDVLDLISQNLAIDINTINLTKHI